MFAPWEIDRSRITDSLPKCLQQPRLGWAKLSSLEFHLDLPRGWQGLTSLGPLMLCINRKLKMAAEPGHEPGPSPVGMPSTLYCLYQISTSHVQRLWLQEAKYLTWTHTAHKRGDRDSNQNCLALDLSLAHCETVTPVLFRNNSRCISLLCIDQRLQKTSIVECFITDLV